MLVIVCTLNHSCNISQNIMIMLPWGWFWNWVIYSSWDLGSLFYTLHNTPFQERTSVIPAGNDKFVFVFLKINLKFLSVFNTSPSFVGFWFHSHSCFLEMVCLFRLSSSHFRWQHNIVILVIGITELFFFWFLFLMSSICSTRHSQTVARKKSQMAGVVWRSSRNYWRYPSYGHSFLYGIKGKVLPVH